MDNSKQILLISYTFPPYPGIGGRRWAKFSKYLTQLGYDVHVIYASNGTGDISLWLDDIIDNKNIKLYPIKSRYPASLIMQPKTNWQKLNYRFSLFIVKLTSKGTPYDRGWFWNKAMLRKSEKIIETNKIKNVIVSSAPFSNSYYALDLKIKFPDLNLVVDFRDPWTWGDGYGFSILNPKRIKHEVMMEASVIEFSDKVFVPSIEMKNHIILNYPKFINKIILLPHGFDEDEITRMPKKPSQKLRLVLYGTLYSKLDSVFENISLFIKKAQNKISLDIYSSTSTYKNVFETYGLIGNGVNYYSQILPKYLFEKFDEYDYVLIVQPDFAKDFITTKIYEIIYSGTPTLLISKEGKLLKFISENKLGLCFTPDNFSEKINSVFEHPTGAFNIKQFKIDDCSFKFITSDLAKHLK